MATLELLLLRSSTYVVWILKFATILIGIRAPVRIRIQAFSHTVVTWSILKLNFNFLQTIYSLKKIFFKPYKTYATIKKVLNYCKMVTVCQVSLAFFSLSGSAQLQNADPYWIQIHNTAYNLGHLQLQIQPHSQWPW